MNTATLDAIRATFLFTFDCFAVSPSEVADLPEVGNVRFAREILGLLQEHNLVAESDVNGEALVWQTVPINIDDSNHDDAVALIDAWLATFQGAVAQNDPAAKPARRSKASKANPAGLPLCLCGCGLAGKSNYRPGHDARHAGNVAREVLAGRIAATGILSAVYGSEALAAKVAAQVARGNDKIARGTDKAVRTVGRKSLVGQPAWVKVGRWIKQGEVGATTVDANGNETPDSEVVAINYIGKGGEVQTVAVDSAKFVRGVNWDLGSPVA